MDVSTCVVPVDERCALLEPLRRLLTQLSPYVESVSDDVLADRLRDDKLILVVARQGGALVGTATLVVVPTAGLGQVGHVDDVVVDEPARGTGVGRQLLVAVQEEALRLGLRHLDLTSRPTRAAANALYASLGFERRETNVYRLRLPPPNR